MLQRDKHLWTSPIDLPHGYASQEERREAVIPAYICIWLGAGVQAHPAVSFYLHREHLITSAG